MANGILKFIQRLTEASGLSANETALYSKDDGNIYKKAYGGIELLANVPFDGWIPINIPPVYVSATSIRFENIDLSSAFPIGTKIKFTQTTVKYFYVIASAYSGGHTTLTLTGGSDYSVANALISTFAYAHGVAWGFPDYFQYTSTITYTGGSTNPTTFSFFSRFSMVGKIVLLFVNGQLTRGSGNRTGFRFTYPVEITGAGEGIFTVTFAGVKVCPNYYDSGSHYVFTDVMSSDGFMWGTINYRTS